MEDDTTTTTTVDETTTTTTEAPAPEETTTTTTEAEDTTETTTEATSEPMADNVPPADADEAGTANSVPADVDAVADPTEPETPFDEKAHAEANDLEVTNPDNSPVLGEDRPSDPLENTNDAIAQGQAQALHNAPNDVPKA